MQTGILLAAQVEKPEIQKVVPNLAELLAAMPIRVEENRLLVSLGADEAQIRSVLKALQPSIRQMLRDIQ